VSVSVVMLGPLLPFFILPPHKCWGERVRVVLPVCVDDIF
jgi:hypothetical protein